MKYFVKVSRLALLALGIFIQTPVAASNDSITYRLQQTLTASSGRFAPFWLQSQHFGTVSQQAFSNLLRASVEREMTPGKHRLDFSYGLDVMVNAANGQPAQAWVQQLYLHSRWWIFDLTIGVRENQHLLTDRFLSSGALIFSPNARPMPRITIGIEEFTAVPFTKKQVQFRGGLSHGWFSDNTYVADIWLHHKYLHLRLGAALPVRLQLGLDHMAQWGGQLPDYPAQEFTFSNFKTIFLARSGVEGSSVFEQNNAMGNHIISEHVRLEADIAGFTAHVYWQNIIEDSPVRLAPWKMMNREDGQWGLSIENKKSNFIRKIVYELVNTTDQSGYIHDKDGIVYGGQDCYLTNGTYMNDWAFYRRTIGTPLILSPVFNADGSFRINHHRLRAHHAGIQGSGKNWRYHLMTTHVRYYDWHLKPESTNFMWMIKVARQLGGIDPVEIEVSIGGDRSSIPGNTTGLQFTFRKSGILFRP